MRKESNNICLRLGLESNKTMPLQIRSKEEAENLIEKATEIRVVKGKGDSVKLKLRTPKALYTFVTTADDAAAMTKGLKTPIIDF